MRGNCENYREGKRCLRLGESPRAKVGSYNLKDVEKMFYNWYKFRSGIPILCNQTAPITRSLLHNKQGLINQYMDFYFAFLTNPRKTDAPIVFNSVGRPPERITIHFTLSHFIAVSIVSDGAPLSLLLTCIQDRSLAFDLIVATFHPHVR